MLLFISRALSLAMLSLVLVALQSCRPDLHYHSAKVIVSHELYLLQYKRNWGVQGGEMKYFYLTDSSSFRKYVGSAGEEEHLKVQLKGDALFVEKYSWRNATGRSADLVDADQFYLSRLKVVGTFEE
jgi:hypothetical protein